MVGNGIGVGEEISSNGNVECIKNLKFVEIKCGWLVSHRLWIMDKMLNIRDVVCISNVLKFWMEM